MSHSIFLILFSILFITISLFSGCGIPDYPYLYPPDALSDPDVGFDHDPLNDPDVFLGYDIYYKFYKTDPDTGIAESEKNIYFNSSLSFTSISYNEEGSSSSSYTNGFRKLLIDIDPGNGISPERPDQLEIDILARDDVFTVTFIDENDKITVTLDDDYPGGPLSYDCYRIVKDTSGSDYKSFLPFSSEAYEIGSDNDIDHIDSIDFNNDNFYVAFFAVTYGRDDNGVDIFSNYSSDGMVYIGSFAIN